MTAKPAGAIGAHNAKVMNRFDLTKRLVAQLKHDEAVIGGIGNANFDLWASGQRPQNFYMLGSMGLAIPIALGVAIAQPRRHVIALEGDGSLLMQLGCLATVAERAPKNLTMVVWDNGIYQITGSQPTPGAGAAERPRRHAQASRIRNGRTRNRARRIRSVHLGCGGGLVGPGGPADRGGWGRLGPLGRAVAGCSPAGRRGHPMEGTGPAVLRLVGRRVHQV